MWKDLQDYWKENSNYVMDYYLLQDEGIEDCEQNL